MNPISVQDGTQITRCEALAAADARGTLCSPAAALIEATPGRLPHVLAIGRTSEIQHHPAWSAAKPVMLASSVLLPGFVNAHTHLDLTHLGPRPYHREGGFVGWIEMIRSGRAVDEAAIARSVQEGIALSRAGGTVAIGDIAGAVKGRPCFAAFEALDESPLLGVSFLEFFGIGSRMAAARQGMPDLAAQALGRQSLGKRGRMRVGLQPHAPNTVDLRVYAAAAVAAAERGLALSTHLAETLEEREFVATGAGPQRRLLEDLGIWDSSVLERLGAGLHPVEHLASALAMHPFLVAHVNDCDDSAIQTLARTTCSVAYCPRASSYFGAERVFGPHRYREMLDAGVNVCLGTDSVVNLPTSAAEAGRGGISVLDEARFLFRRDGTDPKRLVAMATINGARALGIDPSLFEFRAEGEIAGMVAVPVSSSESDPLRAVLASEAPARLLVNSTGIVTSEVGRGC